MRDEILQGPAWPRLARVLGSAVPLLGSVPLDPALRRGGDAGDPVEIARRYDEQGADEITFLDITASSDGRAPAAGVI